MIRWVLALVGVLGMAALAARRSTGAPASVGMGGLVFAPWSEVPGEGAAPAEEPDQQTNFLEDVMVAIDPTTYLPAAVPADVAQTNRRAFLDMIAWAEGTAGDDGYRTLFGGGTFGSFADHPRIYVPFRSTSSSAAGRYQILARTWDGVRTKLGLPDFSPPSQDAAALELIRERGALNDVDAGRVAGAIAKVRKVWASLPGAGYNQPERGLVALLGVYQQAGGNIA